MSNKNPYLSPNSVQNGTSLSFLSWLKIRPIPVVVIFVLSCIPLPTTIWVMLRSDYFDMVAVGEKSVLSAIIYLFQPTLLLLSSFAFFCLKRYALNMYVVYLLVSLLNLSGGTSITGVLDIMFMACVTLYSWWLRISNVLV